MHTTRYALKWTLDIPYQEGQKRVREALAAEGFGIITEIDMMATLKQKLGVDTEPYVILGACQPQLAHRALELDPDIGVLLPCNVVVRQQDGGCEVIAFDPEAGLALAENPELQTLGREVRARLQKALERLPA